MPPQYSARTFHKKIMVAVLILSIFVFVVATSSIYVQEHIFTGNVCGCAIPIYLFIPFMASLGLLIGTLTYYLLSPSLGNDLKQRKLVLALLRDDEAKIMRVLMDSNGESTQARIAKQANLDKLRVHRAVRRLEKRGIVVRERVGRVVVVRINDPYRKLFFSE